MKIGKETVVTFHYTLKNDKGEVLDSSEGHEPMAYLHGEGAIVAGLENALEGRVAGDEFSVIVEPAEGYGEFDESLVQGVPREHFDDHEVEVGMQFHADTFIGPRVVTVVAIDEEQDQVVIDANHELADENLHFDVKVVDVREATKEELDHGHVHGEHGHHH